MSNLIELTDDPDVVLADYAIAKQIAEILHTHYPGHLWGVTAQSDQGIATVRNLRFSGNWGFVLKLRDIVTHKELVKRTKWAGGELLERYNMPRGKFHEDKYAQLYTDFAGQIKAEK